MAKVKLEWRTRVPDSFSPVFFFYLHLLVRRVSNLRPILAYRARSRKFKIRFIDYATIAPFDYIVCPVFEKLTLRSIMDTILYCYTAIW